MSNFSPVAVGVSLAMVMEVCRNGIRHRVVVEEGEGPSEWLLRLRTQFPADTIISLGADDGPSAGCIIISGPSPLSVAWANWRPPFSAAEVQEP